MIKHLLFIQGGGSQVDYDADGKLVVSLQSKLGPGYSIRYPLLPTNETPDFGRRKQISYEIAQSEDGVILVGHSLGASMLLKCLTEVKISRQIAGVFLLATPFWSGDEDWVKALKLQPGFAKQLDQAMPLYFYHCQDDAEVPFAQLATYKQHVPWASFREFSTGGHQFNNDLSVVAKDIQSL